MKYVLVAAGLFSIGSVHAQAPTSYAPQGIEEIRRQAVIQAEIKRQAAAESKKQSQVQAQKQPAPQSSWEREAAVQRLITREYGGQMAGNTGTPLDVEFASLAKKISKVLNAAAKETFVVTFNPLQEQAVLARPGRVIEINPVLFEGLSKPQQDFLLMQEASHHLLGHGPVPKLSTETEADHHAAKLMREKLGYSRRKVVKTVHELFANAPADAFHPLGIMRAGAIERELND